MQISWIPMDLTSLTTGQQDDMFIAWCKLVMQEVAKSARAVLKFEEKGEVGPAATKNIQGAQVWVEGCTPNVLVAFNDYFDNSIPNQSHPDVHRNDPAWYGPDLIARAREHQAEFAAGTMGAAADDVQPRPAIGDIEV